MDHDGHTEHMAHARIFDCNAWKCLLRVRHTDFVRATEIEKTDSTSSRWRTEPESMSEWASEKTISIRMLKICSLRRRPQATCFAHHSLDFKNSWLSNASRVSIASMETFHFPSSWWNYTRMEIRVRCLQRFAPLFWMIRYVFLLLRKDKHFGVILPQQKAVNVLYLWMIACRRRFNGIFIIIELLENYQKRTKQKEKKKWKMRILTMGDRGGQREVESVERFFSFFI